MMQPGTFGIWSLLQAKEELSGINQCSEVAHWYDGMGTLVPAEGVLQLQAHGLHKPLQSAPPSIVSPLRPLVSLFRPAPTAPLFERPPTVHTSFPQRRTSPDNSPVSMHPP